MGNRRHGGDPRLQRLADFINAAFREGPKGTNWWKAYDLIPEFDRLAFPQQEVHRFVSAAEMKLVRDAEKMADQPTRPQETKPVQKTEKRAEQKALF